MTHAREKLIDMINDATDYAETYGKWAVEERLLTLKAQADPDRDWEPKDTEYEADECAAYGEVARASYKIREALMDILLSGTV